MNALAMLVMQGSWVKLSHKQMILCFIESVQLLHLYSENFVYLVIVNTFLFIKLTWLKAAKARL